MASGSEADLLQKIRQAELEANKSIEDAKKEADGIVKQARDQAAATVKSAEDAARMQREKILADGDKNMQAELQAIAAEASQSVAAVKNKRVSAKVLQQLVLEVLEE